VSARKSMKATSKPLKLASRITTSSWSSDAGMSAGAIVVDVEVLFAGVGMPALGRRPDLLVDDHRRGLPLIALGAGDDEVSHLLELSHPPGQDEDVLRRALPVVREVTVFGDGPGAVDEPAQVQPPGADVELLPDGGVDLLHVGVSAEVWDDGLDLPDRQLLLVRLALHDELRTDAHPGDPPVDAPDNLAALPPRPPLPAGLAQPSLLGLVQEPPETQHHLLSVLGLRHLLVGEAGGDELGHRMSSQRRTTARSSTKQMSKPPPPLMKSAPGPPVTTSSPIPPNIASFPLCPKSTSLPGPPRITSA